MPETLDVQPEAPSDIAPSPTAQAPPPVVPAYQLSRWVWLATLGTLVLLIALAADLAGLVLLGAILAYLLIPLVDGLERRGMGRTQATLLVVVGLGALFGVAMALGLPVVLEQMASLQARRESGELLQLVRDAEAGLAARLGFLEPSELGLVDAAREALRADAGPLIGYVPSLLQTIGNSVIVPFVLFTLLRDGPTLRRKLLAVVPNRYFEFAMTVAYKADAHLGGYLRGQALIASLVGASTALGLGLLGVDYYLVLGVVTGLANFVPYAGFLVSASLSVLVSIVTTGGTDQVAAVIGLFLVLQTVENIVFQPWITGKNVSMHPVMVLLAILVGGRLAGVAGMALAVPAAAVLKVVFLETVVGLRRYHL
ncbi:AI-2E family transporter [Rubrivirga sp. IMCC45206]|uniref:AI-2E family transporter n=1 Tax=Rubrivirga sp. IMCC45206 TaxID=3391614 RepID=UPI00398FD1EF